MRPTSRARTSPVRAWRERASPSTTQSTTLFVHPHRVHALFTVVVYIHTDTCHNLFTPGREPRGRELRGCLPRGRQPAGHRTGWRAAGARRPLSRRPRRRRPAWRLPDRSRPDGRSAARRGHARSVTRGSQPLGRQPRLRLAAGAYICMYICSLADWTCMALTSVPKLRLRRAAGLDMCMFMGHMHSRIRSTCRAWAYMLKICIGYILRPRTSR